MIRRGLPLARAAAGRERQADASRLAHPLGRPLCAPFGWAGGPFGCGCATRGAIGAAIVGGFGPPIGGFGPPIGDGEEGSREDFGTPVGAKVCADSGCAPPTFGGVVGVTRCAGGGLRPSPGGGDPLGLPPGDVDNVLGRPDAEPGVPVVGADGETRPTDGALGEVVPVLPLGVVGVTAAEGIEVAAPPGGAGSGCPFMPGNGCLASPAG